MEQGIIGLILHAGGVVKFVLLVLGIFSVFSWAIIGWKYLTLKKAKRDTDAFLPSFLRFDDFDKIHVAAKNNPFSPQANIFRATLSELKRRITLYKELKEGGAAYDLRRLAEDMDLSIRRESSQRLDTFAKNLNFLATVGSTSPFIGLFGTVWGIMNSFRGIGRLGAASLAVVAPGISEALIATALGLFVAIPAVMAYNYFQGRIEIISREVEEFSRGLVLHVRRWLEEELNHGV